MSDLRDLLRTHQGTVYRIAFQVLRREHDAEDATQDVLLEIVRDAGRLHEPRAIKRWICRIALHTALDHLRRRDRRARHEEARAAMNRPASAADDAVHDAMERLDDEDRCLLVEKYFEGATLEEIGAREGISAAAVGKRVDRAKDNLKRRLVQAGMAAIVPHVDQALKAVTSPLPIPDLVSGSQAVQAALTLAGGAAMSAKSIPLAIAAAVLLVVLLGGGAIAIRTGRDSTPAPSSIVSARTPEPATLIEEREGRRKTEPRVEVPAESKTAPDPAELLARLDRYKEWLQKVPASFKTSADVDRWFDRSKAEAEGLRDLIFQDPATFLAWLEANPTCASNLFAVTLCGKTSMWMTPAQEFSAFPRALTDGLLALLRGGDDFLRAAVLQFAITVKDPPAEYRDQYAALLTDREDFVAEHAAKALLTTGTLTPAEVGAVASYLERVEDFEKRANLLQSIGRVPREDIRDWMLTTLESQRFADPDGRLTYAALSWWLDPERSPGAAFHDRAGRILAAAMRTVQDPQGYFYLLWGGASLPLVAVRSLLTQAMSSAPSEQLRRAAAAMIARPDADLKDAPARRVAWLDAYWAK